MSNALSALVAVGSVRAVARLLFMINLGLLLVLLPCRRVSFHKLVGKVFN